ncbi:MAG TPA: NADH-quinone oxidoreductase subunit M, partial [Actinomycetes bacterium]|nr:NADH-quinone oxidoreductase subunit M [Actinomycetes bacterium]
MSGDFPWLTVVGAIPLVGAIAVMLVPRSRPTLAKQLALLFSVATAGLAIAMATQFETGTPGFQFVEQHEWIPDFGVSYALGVDGIALVLIALAVILVPIVILASWHDADPVVSAAASDRDPPPKRPVRTFFALILVLETMMVGVFAATDIFLFYVLFEAMLIPMYFLIGSYGGVRRSYAAVKFLLYSLFGGLLMLAAVIGLYVVAKDQLGAGTFDFISLAGAIQSGQLEIDPEIEKLLFAGFFIAFAIKAPLVPFHTWLPDAAAEATPGSAVLLVGVLDKVGTFGMLRYCL